MFLANETGREAESLPQKEINRLEAEHAEAKQNKDNFTEERIDSSDAAMEPFSHISDFTSGELQMPTVQPQAVHSPHLTLTLIKENCLMGSTKAKQDEHECQGIQKFFSQSTFLVTCTHERLSSQDTQTGGMLINKKCHAHPLIALDVDPTHPKATVNNLMSLTWMADAPPTTPTLLSRQTWTCLIQQQQLTTQCHWHGPLTLEQFWNFLRRFRTRANTMEVRN